MTLPDPSPAPLISKGFRLRGREASRIEGLSDAVFGFALTLLVVSLEVPRTFQELMNAMHGFFAFAVCFTLLAMVWHEHYTFFRRYGLQDETTRVLNAILLFVVLFFVYPLKFVFSMLADQAFGFHTPAGVPEPIRSVLDTGEASLLMVIYGAGYMAVFAVFACLYGHAWRRRDALELDAGEKFETRTSLESCIVHISVGFVSVVVAALAATPIWVSISGFSYFLLAPALTIHGTLSGRRRRRLGLDPPS
jgi:uncharacterized membrane protein